ncbi:LysM peptidoglycan-binding domain-containing protein [Brachybacterium horti]
MHTRQATVTALPLRGASAVARPARAGVRLEVTRRGRMLVTAIAFLLGLAVAALALLVLDVPSALAGDGADGERTVTVSAGDDLWSYADLYAPEGMSDADFVTEVRALNELPTPRLTQGQEIVLPAADPAGR